MPTLLDAILASGAAGSGAFDQPRLPIFPRAIKECTTADSSPYLCSFDDFALRYGNTPHRAGLTSKLAEYVGGSGRIGVQISSLLIGGSFVDRENEAPRDIDCLVFYSIDATERSVDVIVSEWTSYRKKFPLDVKICPTDAGPITIIKRAIYFSNLFSIDKSSLVLGRGTLLVNLSDQSK